MKELSECRVDTTRQRRWNGLGSAELQGILLPFTLNGRAYPEAEHFQEGRGERVEFVEMRVAGASRTWWPEFFSPALSAAVRCARGNYRNHRSGGFSRRCGKARADQGPSPAEGAGQGPAPTPRTGSSGIIEECSGQLQGPEVNSTRANSTEANRRDPESRQ